MGVDVEAIEARLAALRRADEEYVSVIANRPLDEPEYNYHLRVARREVEAHAPADIAALLAEVERLKARLTALTIDDAMVERAATAMANEWPETIRVAENAMGLARAALLAAGMEEAK